MLVARYGVAMLPQEPIGRERFIENLGRLFDGASLQHERIYGKSFCSAVAAKHGSMNHLSLPTPKKRRDG